MRNCHGDDTTGRPVAMLVDGYGELVFDRCPRRTLPPGFGGYRDPGTFLTLHTLAKEFGMPPSVALQEEAYLLEAILTVESAYAAADWAQRNKPKAKGEKGKPKRKGLGGRLWRRRKAV